MMLHPDRARSRIALLELAWAHGDPQAIIGAYVVTGSILGSWSQVEAFKALWHRHHPDLPLFDPTPAPPCPDPPDPDHPCCWLHLTRREF